VAAAGRYAADSGGYGMTAVDLPRLAADLVVATANLTGWIEARAAELAADRIAAAEAIAVGRVAALEEAFAVERRRHADIEEEFARQRAGWDRWQAGHVRGRCVPAGDTPGP
jgi:hypothetical protein